MADLEDQRKPLLSTDESSPARACCSAEGLCWQVMHAFAFLLGGFTFTCGTLLLFYPSIPDYDSWSALLYTIGSCGFLFVDVQEFFTFGGAILRTNIAMSMIGSFLYVVGSAGFFPAVVAANPMIGIWGFIAGSAFIGCSQLWKTHRIGSSNPSGKFSIAHILGEFDALTAVGVELNAGLGAWAFFFGTWLYKTGPLDGPDSVLPDVLQIWTVGSILFTLGGCSLAFRHFGLGVV